MSGMTGKTGFILVVILAALCLLPWGVSPMIILVLTEALIWVLFAVATNIVLGYGGRITFGHAAFFGTGGYVCAVLLKKFGVGLPVAIICSAVVSTAMGLIIGWFCVRLTHVYFAMLTMAFGQLVWAVVYRWRYVGADTGIIGVPGLDSPVEFYFLVLILVSLSILVIYLVVHSPFGKVLVGTRESEVRPPFIGINVRRQQLVAFVISAFFSGISGGLFVVLNGIAYPDILTWVYSGQVLVMCLLGGMTVLLGPAVGAVILIFLQHWITGYTQNWPLVLGFIIVLLVLFLSNGILGSILDRGPGRLQLPAWLRAQK
jgi:branched-chain amino acid transport system permease protein